MNRMELVAAIAEKTELSKKDAEKALKAFTDVVVSQSCETASTWKPLTLKTVPDRGLFPPW